MAKASTTVEAMTNDTPNSCVAVNCNCITLWSLAQQFSYLRLSNQQIRQPRQFRLINGYTQRARRIAGTYARFYLEQEANGKPDKKGRYYWMGLAAFASKTVACALDGIRARSADTVYEGLGKGNFWLFMDISATHWYYNYSPDSFQQCLNDRDATKYVDEMQPFFRTLPWYQDAPQKINQLKISQEIRKAFDLIPQIENFSGADESTLKKKRSLQLMHLLTIAVHEQLNILQALIYDDHEFSWWLKFPRGEADGVGRVIPRNHTLERALSGQLQLVFTPACDVGDEELKSIAPPGTKLENYESRMTWITQAAQKYHKRMIEHTEQMEAALNTIAGWYALPDIDILPNERMAGDLAYSVPLRSPF
ncbi:hypothetical protein HZU77_014535 [Neisseriaceae bacterium TC5R-5]|nr:hypothetical protein [Neisseriaceae bacterium TC5R-5]